MHPEAVIVRRWLWGRTVEVGCGSNPTPGVDLLVDRTPGGVAGEAGCELGQLSRAGVVADMWSLPLRTGSFQTLVARHTLEHHADTLGVLREWFRVSRRLVIVCPDQATYPGNTVQLDPTHRAAFTPLQLSELVKSLGFTTVLVEPAVPNWSFLLVAGV
ncbi:MAG TPA: methyltransferase domain-containing protein [Candidatus Methylomirabilis sp.]|nr:methyltransferase domain-containing protein [Candidatus Methylomirabilis sp.]